MIYTAIKWNFFMLRIPLRSIIASLAFAIILILSGCKATESTYRKVATDTKVTGEKKAIIAPWVSVYFPIQETIIPGKTITSIDTQYIAYNYTDTINGIVHHYDTVRVSRTINRTDTIKTEDYAKLLIARREISQLSADIVVQEALRLQADKENKSVHGERRNLIYWIVGLCIALLISVYLHIKRFI